MDDFVIKASYHHNLAAKPTRSQQQHLQALYRANVVAVQAQKYTQWMYSLTPRQRAYLNSNGGSHK